MRIIKPQQNSLLVRETLLNGKVLGRKIVKDCSFKPRRFFEYRWAEVKFAVA